MDVENCFVGVTVDDPTSDCVAVSDTVALKVQLGVSVAKSRDDDKESVTDRDIDSAAVTVKDEDQDLRSLV